MVEMPDWVVKAVLEVMADEVAVAVVVAMVDMVALATRTVTATSSTPGSMAVTESAPVQRQHLAAPMGRLAPMELMGSMAASAERVVHSERAALVRIALARAAATEVTAPITRRQTTVPRTPTTLRMVNQSVPTTATPTLVTKGSLVRKVAVVTTLDRAR